MEGTGVIISLKHFQKIYRAWKTMPRTPLLTGKSASPTCGTSSVSLVNLGSIKPFIESKLFPSGCNEATVRSGNSTVKYPYSSMVLTFPKRKEDGGSAK